MGGKWLNPHLGPTKQVLRYHLVLKAAANISSQYLEIWNCSHIPQVWKEVLHVRQGAAQRMWSSPQVWFEPELKEVFESHCKPERLSWEEGSDMYFDDTFLHTAVNLADDERWILWIDVARTDLPWRYSLANRLIIQMAW